MPTSYATLTGADLKLRARDGTIYCNLEEDILVKDGMTVPTSIADLKNGAIITPKINFSVCWTFNKRFGARWVLQEALLTDDDNNQGNKSAAEAGVFTVTEAPPAKKPKTGASVSSD
jgi:hypothetical protein